MTPLTPDRRPWLAAAVAAVVLIAAALTLEWRRAPESRRSPPSPAGVDGPLDLDPDQGSGAGMPESRLPTEADLRRERDEQAMDGLIDLLAGVSELRNAKAIGPTMSAEFQKEPRLKEALDAFKRMPRDSRPPLRRYLRDMAGLPEFRRLAARFAQAAGSSAQARGAVVATPGAVPSVPTGAHAAVHGADRSFATSAVAPPGVAQGIEVSPGGRVQTLVAPAGESGGVGPGRAGRTGGHSAKLARAGGAATLDGAAEGEGGGGGGGGPPGGATGPGAHAVETELKAMTPVGKDDWQSATRYLTELLLVLPKSDRLVIEERLGEEDLWGACFITARYGLCRDTCGKLKESTCTDVPQAFDACWKDGMRGKVDCVRLCTDRSDLRCEVPRSERDDICAPGPSAIPCGYCSSAAPWGPPKCSGDPEVCVPVMGCGSFGGPSVAASGTGPAAQPHPSTGQVTSPGGPECRSGWNACRWVMGGSVSECRPICMRYCNEPDMGQSCGSCSQPPPAPTPLCTCFAVPCVSGFGAGPPNGCEVFGNATCYYGSNGGMTTCVQGRLCP